MGLTYRVLIGYMLVDQPNGRLMIAMTSARPAVPNTPSPRSREITYWIATAISAVAFAVPGVLNLAHAPHVAQDMAHLGYPSYFSTILGTWKLLAALAILAPASPRLKEWAYAGMIFDLTGAAASRAITGDSPATIAIPLVIAGVVAISWTLRPARRRLDPATPWHSPYVPTQ